MTSAASRVHHAIVSSLVRAGLAPSTVELAAATGLSPAEVGSGLRELVEVHGLVLHPGTEEPWVVPPFSLTPTGFWVQGEGRGWWAACIWCALGVCSLVDGDVCIHTRIGGEAGEVVIEVGEGLAPEGLVAHFPIPIARAWDNVHRFCASTLVFESAAEVDGWCRRHGYRRGDVVPLPRVRALASRWYGDYLAEDWRKWTLSEAREIFAEVGLDGPTWELPAGDGEF